MADAINSAAKEPDTVAEQEQEKKETEIETGTKKSTSRDSEGTCTFISIGNVCSVKYQIDAFLKRRGLAQETHFFDWLMTNTRTIIQVFEAALTNTIDAHMKRSALALDGTHGDNAVLKFTAFSHCVSIHDVPKLCNEDDLADCVAKYSRRAHRLAQEVCKRTRAPLLLVRMGSFELAELVELQTKISHLRDLAHASAAAFATSAASAASATSAASAASATSAASAASATSAASAGSACSASVSASSNVPQKGLKSELQTDYEARPIFVVGLRELKFDQVRQGALAGNTAETEAEAVKPVSPFVFIVNMTLFLRVPPASESEAEYGWTKPTWDWERALLAAQNAVSALLAAQNAASN